ncbi:tetratricopeptide repeat protein [Embleya sp. NPDC001921]
MVEFDRRVQVRVGRADAAGRGFGSGYLIAPRLVLTAAHVVDGTAASGTRPVKVSRPDAGGREYPATVVWRRKDVRVDAALVEVADLEDLDGKHVWPVPGSLADLIARPPQRFGHLIGTRPHPVTLTGYPGMQKDVDGGPRLDEQLTGRVPPGTGALAERYEVLGDDPMPRTEAAVGVSPWAGFSGAPVMADDGQGGDFLLGVVRYDRRADGGVRLTATRAAHLICDDAFRAVISRHTRWDPALEPVEPAGVLAHAAPRRDRKSPASLLSADAEAVAFHGRDVDLAEHVAWCAAGPAGVAVRVLTGPGGQGKTRLARRLTDTLSRQGWATGHLRSDLDDHRPPPNFSCLSTALPLLVVVDYAETRPRVLRDLVTALHHSRHRVRILLLARSDGPWRTGPSNAQAAVRDLLDAEPAVELAPLLPHRGVAEPPGGQTHTGWVDRGAAFRAAARGLAELLPLLPTVPAHDWAALAAALHPPGDLDHPRYANALTLQLAALVALLQHGPSPADTAPGTAPEEILLRHEARFWEDTAKASAVKLGNLPTFVLGAAVATAALCGAADQDEAAAVLRALPHRLKAGRALRAAAWVKGLYPAEPGRYWGTLQPDRIAEFHASRALADKTIALAELLPVAAPAQQAQLITVVARAAIAHYNAGRTRVSEALVHHLDTHLETSLLHPYALAAATVALPHPSRVIAPFAVRLNAALVEAALQQDPDDAAYGPDLALSLSNVGIRLAEVGRRDEALAAEQQAVEIYRRLATANPDAHEPDLARSLSHLGVHLGEVGRRDEAVVPAEQAVEIRRRLATANPDAHEPGLAASLTNLGVRLAEVGRRSEALTATEQAAEIYRRLATTNPAGYASDLALSLSNLGVSLAEVGRRHEALAAEQQAVEIYRRLAATNPAAYEPGLAASLSNLGAWLAEVGRRNEGLAATEGAVEIYRRLATANPDAHEPGLARSLSDLGADLARVGRRDEALAAAEQAVEIHRRLATANPAAYEPGLARSLSNLGAWLAEVGRRNEGLAAAEQAVEIYRRLAATNPAAYEPDLATSLTNLGAWLAEVGRRNEGLAATEQAVAIRRRLAAANPAAYEPDLADSLTNVGVRLAETGRRNEAMVATEQAVAIYQRLATANPDAYERDLAVSLANLSVDLGNLGRHDEALATEQQAVDIYRRLATTNPAAYEPGLAALLSNLGVHLGEVGRRDEALAAAEQAVEMHRRLATTNPAAYEPGLAASLSNLGADLEHLGRFDEALAAAEQAVEIYRRLATTNPAAYEPDLARFLANLGVHLGEVGRRDEALAAAEQAVEICRRYKDMLPTLIPLLLGALDLQVALLDALGRENEAAAIRRRLDTNALPPGTHN